MARTLFGGTAGSVALAAGLLMAAAPWQASGQSSGQGWSPAGEESVEDLTYRLGLAEAELAAIRARLQQLTGGAAGGGAGTGSGSVGSEAMIRLDRLETELRRLTGKIEELAFRQRRMAEDAARRFEDIGFRLTELEGGDVAALAPQPPLGTEAPATTGGAGTTAASESTAGGVGTAAASSGLSASSSGAEPADAGEAAEPETAVAYSDPGPGDLDRAIDDIKQGRFDQGERRLERYITENPDGPRLAEAHYWLGRSQFVRGNLQQAARLFLEGYNRDRRGAMAAENLLELGITLGRLGQVNEACLTLREVRSQFPDAPRKTLTAADVEADNLACG